MTNPAFSNVPLTSPAQAQRAVHDATASSIPLLHDLALVLLVTPEFMSWTDSSNNFIPDLLQKSLQRSKQGGNLPKYINVISGVVDAIPIPHGALQTQNPTRSIGQGTDSSAEGNSAMRSKFRGQGISALFMPSSMITLESLSASGLVGRLRKPDFESKATLSVDIAHPRSATGLSSHSRTSVPSIRTIRQLLANTLFINGRSSTLIKQRWQYSPERTQFVLESNQYFKSLTLGMKHASAEAGAVHLHINPLHVSCSPPRVVASCLGNVLRELFLSGRSGDKTTAAADLEANVVNVTSEIRDRLQSEGKTPMFEVWAAVTPAASASGVLLDNVDDLNHQVLLGTKLHRVLSGGGGWGSKQGLIAIDYDEYNTDSGDGSMADPLMSLFGGGSKAHQTKQPVVSPGDVVQFFVFYSYREAGASSDNLLSNPPSNTSVNTGFHFGSLPASQDEVVPEPASTKEDVSRAHYWHIPSFFGAMSYDMSLSVQNDAGNGVAESDAVQQTRLPPWTEVQIGHHDVP